MNVYTTEKIRNVVLLGHSGCGKTSLVEAMAYLAGQTTRMGTVADGSTISDFDKEEIKRQFSIHTSVVPIEWDNVKINILDTPGFFDFVCMLYVIHRTGINNSFRCKVFIEMIQSFQIGFPVLTFRFCPSYLGQCRQTGKQQIIHILGSVAELRPHAGLHSH